MNKSYSPSQTVAFRFASAPHALVGFLLSAFSILVLAILGFVTTSQVQRKQPEPRGQAEHRSRPGEPARPVLSTSPAGLGVKPIENGAYPPMELGSPPAARPSAASPDTSRTRRIRTADGSSKAVIPQSTRPSRSRSRQGDLLPLIRLTTDEKVATQPSQCRAVTEGRAKSDTTTGSAANLKSASMPHLPQVKRTPKLILSTPGDKATSKQSTSISRARSPEGPQYAALPGLPGTGDSNGEGRKANTSSGVKFEQYHMWSRKARSLRNLKAAQAEPPCHPSGFTSTSPRSLSPPPKQKPLDAQPRPSISSVLLSADAYGGNAPSARQRYISGDTLLEPLSTESSSEGSSPYSVLYARSMSTTALPELVERQPETTSKHSSPWLLRFRRRASSISESAVERSKT